MTRPSKTATHAAAAQDEPRGSYFSAAASLIPNIMTLVALCCGISALRFGFEGRFELAITFILAAALLDALDGGVARVLGAESRFGAELDSLADLVNFGLAPALILYLWSLEPLGYLGWGVTLCFAMCSALRLARFNANMLNPRRPAWMANYFQGIPAPAAAFVLLLPFYLARIMAVDTAVAEPWVIIYALTISGLMITRWPTFSGKLIGRRMTRAMLLPPAAALLAIGAAMIVYPWHVLAGLCVGYLLTLPFSFWRYRRMVKRHGEPTTKQNVL